MSFLGCNWWVIPISLKTAITINDYQPETNQLGYNRRFISDRKLSTAHELWPIWAVPHSDPRHWSSSCLDAVGRRQMKNPGRAAVVQLLDRGMSVRAWLSVQCASVSAATALWWKESNFKQYAGKMTNKSTSDRTMVRVSQTLQERHLKWMEHQIGPCSWSQPWGLGMMHPFRVWRLISGCASC